MAPPASASRQDGQADAEGKQLASGFLHLMMSQLVSRVFTFGLNLFIARKLTPDEFGLAALQFQLLTSSILFISREGFRRGCLRGDTSGSGSPGPSQPAGQLASGSPAVLERIMRVAWLCVPLGALTTVLACGSVLLWQSVPLSDPYAHSILLLGLASLLELGSEPLYILAQTLLLIKFRAGMEALASLVRCIVTLLLVLLNMGRVGGVLFAIAEVGYGGTLLIGYWFYFCRLKLPSPKSDATSGKPAAQEVSKSDKTVKQRKSAAPSGKPSGEAHALLPQEPEASASLPLFPFRLSRSQPASVSSGTATGTGKRSNGGRGAAPLLDWALLRLCLAFSLQSLVKLVLGKGDEFVLVMLESRFNQGVYGLVSKLGSLVVRCILQPFEESAFILFAKTAPPLSSTATLSPEEVKRRQTSAGNVLTLSLKLVTLLGLVFVVFGPSYSRLLLQILYGSRWTATEAPAALACYCLYIMALALNGTTEAFVHAVMSEAQLASSNVWLTLFSVLHMGLSIALVRLASAPGLILANCCNMGMRIAFCLYFISDYFKDLKSFSLSQALPSKGVFITFLLVAGATHISNYNSVPPQVPEEASKVVALRLAQLVPPALHVLVGATGLVGVFLALYAFDKAFLDSVAALLPGSKGGAHLKEE